MLRRMKDDIYASDRMTNLTGTTKPREMRDCNEFKDGSTLTALTSTTY